MRKMKTVFVALLLVVGASSAYAGCLNDYNNDLNNCSLIVGFFQRSGCEADAWLGYYDCILDKALS